MKSLHTKSDYEYQVHSNYILIKDLDKGGMSVTNNIENIVEFIADKEDLCLLTTMAIYQDSEGDIDAFDYQSKSFIILPEKIRNFAKQKMIEI